MLLLNQNVASLTWYHMIKFLRLNSQGKNRLAHQKFYIR